jgi:DNA-directed RNA polymerase subunit RPC12/RpoP
MYMSRLDSINGQALFLRRQLSDIERRVYNLDEALNRLPSRVQMIRKMNYKIMSNLEKDVAALSERWPTVKQSARDIVNVNVPAISSELSGLEAEIAVRRADTSYDVAHLASAEVKASTLGVRVSDLNSKVSSALGDVGNRLQTLDQDVDIAERTVNLAANASFPWKQDESPILSINAKDMKKDTDGIITFTNQRFIFESDKEVVLKKMLFIATEKKRVRETVIEKPIGMVDTVTKGRVGLLAGQGLYISFKPQSGLPEMKLDTKGSDADQALRFYQFISTGQADQELSALEGTKPEEKISIPVVCPRCGAPYSDEIYRGQTSVQCKYCGTTIPINR